MARIHIGPLGRDRSGRDDPPQSGGSQPGPSQPETSRPGGPRAPQPQPQPQPPTGGTVGPGPEVERRAPDTPTRFSRQDWIKVTKRTFAEFQQDQLTDRAATLTYYGVLSLFPALLVLVSLLGVAGRSATQQVLAHLQHLAPGAVRSVLVQSVRQLQGHGGTGSVIAVIGLLAAVWSASGYVSAFMRAANAVYEVPEGRPFWKTTPLRLGVTVVLMLLVCASALIVVFTGGLARSAGNALGLGSAAVTAWSIAKWPVLVLLVIVMIGILYWAAPNAKLRGFRWITPGSVLALLVWLAASGGFAVYVANFGSYNKTYGTLAAVIIFLVWLWISNLAILFGLEFDAEMARERAIAGGHPADEEPYVEPRSTATWSKEDRAALSRDDRAASDHEERRSA